MLRSLVSRGVRDISDSGKGVIVWVDGKSRAFWIRPEQKDFLHDRKKLAVRRVIRQFCVIQPAGLVPDGSQGSIWIVPGNWRLPFAYRLNLYQACIVRFILAIKHLGCQNNILNRCQFLFFVLVKITKIKVWSFIEFLMLVHNTGESRKTRHNRLHYHRNEFSCVMFGGCLWRDSVVIFKMASFLTFMKWPG